MNDQADPTSHRQSAGAPALAIALATVLTALGALAACGGGSVRTGGGDPQAPLTGTVRIAYLHHSTGGNVWAGGVPGFIAGWSKPAGTAYTITELTYPAAPTGGYPWANYPYDYWNLWVNFTGANRDRGELNLDDLVAAYDVIVWKHCFPVSGIEADGATASVSSPAMTIANYQLQYAALKARMRQFPGKRFVVWTGAALTEGSTTPDAATRARQFFSWVKTSWDEKGDNIYVWDFQQLETDGGLYLRPDYAAGPTDSHPNATLSSLAAPLLGKRIVDVIEGRGDTGSLTGQ
jgi:hypothetical protein